MRSPVRRSAGSSGFGEAVDLAGRLIVLDPTEEDKRQARETLLGLLASQTELAWVTADLAGKVVQLPSAAEDKRPVREELLRLVATETDSWLPPSWRTQSPSSTRRRRTSARPARGSSNC
jgi:hypothetical protein